MSEYRSQVSLLLQVLPEVANEPVFALHGGTAINLFVRNMPRLSVDIDLTYTLIESREASLKTILTHLDRLKTKFTTSFPKACISLQRQTLKLYITTSNAQIKLEVNQINRGLIGHPVTLILCEKAQQEFDAFCSIPVVPLGQLYGGKICAALDRQHPRDLFDIKYFLENEAFNEEIKKGFLLFLLSSNRPLHEMLRPNYIDHKETLMNQFSGMSQQPFTYEDFERTRDNLVTTIHQNLDATDKAFLKSFSEGTPDWDIHNLELFPGVKWKIKNLVKLKNQDPKKHKRLVAALDKVLFYPPNT